MPSNGSGGGFQYKRKENDEWKFLIEKERKISSGV